MADLDKYAVERQTITVTLAGRTYTWVEPGARKAREAVAELAAFRHLERIRHKPQDEWSEDEAAAMLQGINGMLDFFYRHHGGMEQDRDYLDDNATPEEIGAAFGEVVQLLTLPLLSNPRRREVADTIRTRSKSGETTTP